MTLILINGYAGAGKDTFVKFFTEEAEKNDQRVVNLSSITPVWQMLKNQGIDMDRKGPEERKLAAETKAALDNYDFYATRMVLEKAHESLINSQYVFIHMREPRALEFSSKYWNRYRNQYPCLTLFIDRPQPALAVGNVADDSVRDYIYNSTVRNVGDLDELKKVASAYFYQVRNNHEDHQ